MMIPDTLAGAQSLHMLRHDLHVHFKDFSVSELSLEMERTGLAQLMRVEEEHRFAEAVTVNEDSAYLPVVQCHGMGDFATNPLGMEPLKNMISKALNGTLVVNVPLADNFVEDSLASFTMPLDEEVDMFAKFVQSDPRFANGFNAVGYSQGNLWLRGYVERYNSPPVKNWIAVNGPFQGVAGFPQCSYSSEICRLFDQFVGDLAYTDLAQNVLAQTNYFRDPLRIPAYKKGCKYLPYMNNEVEADPTRSANLMKTDKLIAVLALNDTEVIPKESEHFGFYKDGSQKEIQKMEDTPLYQQNLFGLKDFHEQGHLEFVEAPGNHLQIPSDQLLGLVNKFFTSK